MRNANVTLAMFKVTNGEMLVMERNLHVTYKPTMVFVSALKLIHEWNDFKINWHNKSPK